MTATVSVTSTETQTLVSTPAGGVVTSLEGQVLMTTPAAPRVSGVELQVLTVGPFSIPDRARRRVFGVTYA